MVPFILPGDETEDFCFEEQLCFVTDFELQIE